MATIRLTDCLPEAPDGSRSFLPKQLQFFNAAMDTGKESKKFVRYCGGIGCVAPYTHIQTSEGTKPISSLGLSDRILSHAGLVEGSVPFPKGKARLYRVVHERGIFLAYAAHLVFSYPGEYRRADSLRVGDALAKPSLSSFSLPPTNLEPFPRESLSDEHRLWKRCEGFVSNCLACYDQYGQLPPEALSIAQDVVPSLVDALRPVLSPSGMDALEALAQKRIRPYQLIVLLSSLDYAAHLGGLTLDAVAQASAQFSEPILDEPPSSLLSPSKSEPHRSAQSDENSRVLFSPSRILSIELSEEEEWYWDIQIPGANSYVAEGALHHNSGKSVVGCVTVLAWALQYPGDYLIGRQFAPELRDTTFKTFLELCPKELILEHRVADAIVKIKSARGEISNIFFRHLEEPDKHRSMNLNGFYIDESSQVSEAAFLLLQGRLRGRYVRKGILTTNSAGHDWGWRYFVKQDMFTRDEAKKQFFNIKAPSTENVHLPEGYVQSMFDSWSEDRVRREILADEDSFEGAIFSEFRRDVHVCKPFKIPDEWTRIVGVDHGLKNPSAWIWGAVDYNGDIYIYREFYEAGWLIEQICRGFNVNGIKKPGVLELMRKPDGSLEKIEGAYIDPSTRASRGQTGASDYDYYLDYLPKDFPLTLAKNDVEPGINRVKTYLKVSPVTNKPSLFIFDTCKNLIEEITNYQYEEIPVGQIGKRAEKETPKKVNDHAVDALRYLITSRPEAPKPEDNRKKLLEMQTLEGSLMRELEQIRNPKSKQDIFRDY